MSMEQVLAAARALDDVDELAPTEGSEAPPIAWGDHFFTYAGGGAPAANTQPFATVVTKDYPDDTASDLDPPGRYRVNVQVAGARLAELTADLDEGLDPATPDVLRPHPTYPGWVCVINPGGQTMPTVLRLLDEARAAARSRAERRDRH